jgi:oligopeptide/dipeptide ABC transporter ATP-binding protein
MASLPGKRTGEKRLASIPGTVPDLSSVPPGCPFADRCPFRQDALSRFRSGEIPEDPLAVCDRDDPPPHEYAPGHFAACHHQRAVRGGGAP